MAGVNVGKVSDVELDDQKVLVTFTVQDGVALGEQTAADIKTNTVLGRKSLAVRPEGSGLLRTDTPIPIERTNSPYSLNDALGDLGTTVSELDTEQINDSLNAISDTLADTPPELRTALDGMTRLSQSINSRDESLLQLLSRAEDVTKILSDRSGQIDSLLVDGNKLFAELSLRRDAISELIVKHRRSLTSTVSAGAGERGPDGADPREAEFGRRGSPAEQGQHRGSARRTRDRTSPRSVRPWPAARSSTPSSSTFCRATGGRPWWTPASRPSRFRATWKTSSPVFHRRSGGRENDRDP